MEDLQEHYRLKYKEADGFASYVVQVAIEMVSSNKRNKHAKKPNKYREYQKLFWNYRYENWVEDEFKERLGISRETFTFILE